MYRPREIIFVLYSHVLYFVLYSHVLYFVLYSHVLYFVLYSHVLYFVLYSHVLYFVLYSHVLYFVLYSHVLYFVLYSHVLYFVLYSHTQPCMVSRDVSPTCFVFVSVCSFLLLHHSAVLTILLTFRGHCIEIHLTQLQHEIYSVEIHFF